MNRKWINQSPDINEKKTREVVAEKIEDCFFNKKEELNLSYRTISPKGQKLTSLPPMIGALFHLKSLNISGHAVTELPKMTSYLKNLEHLNLNDNQFKKFPEDIIQIIKLQSLNIGGNDFPNLPKNFGHLSQLKKLNLRDNKLTEIPDSFIRLDRLEKLGLTRNLFDENTIYHLPQLQDFFSRYKQKENIPSVQNSFYGNKSLGWRWLGRDLMAASLVWDIDSF